MKKRTKGLLLITVFFALGFLLVHFFFTNSDALLLDNEFLITFVGVVLGISATIVTFIFSSTEKIQKVISNLSHEKNRTDKINKIFKTAYAELIEDSSFIFIIFILLIICVLFSAIDIPYISFPAFMPKSQFLDSIKIGLFLNCIFSIGDLFFSLSNILRLVLYENSTKQ